MSEATYDVVLLVEQTLSADDVQRIRSLHQNIDDPVHYHVLMPCEDAAARVETALGSVAASEVLATPTITMDPDDVRHVQQELDEKATEDVGRCVDRLAESGDSATGDVVRADPIVALATKVKATSAQEVIVLTRPHVVAEFFHVDWTSRARRKLGVPILHLLEHETFDEQAGGGEGASLL
ncbi:MAG: hypothetical protein ACRDPI_07290 [Nocardioidaceae bacterium]